MLCVLSIAFLWLSKPRLPEHPGIHLQFALHSQIEHPEKLPRKDIGGFECIVPLHRSMYTGICNAYLKGYAAFTDGSKLWGIWKLSYDTRSKQLFIGDIHAQYMESPDWVGDPTPRYALASGALSTKIDNIEFPFSKTSGVWSPIQPIINGRQHVKSLYWTWSSEGIVDLDSLTQKVNSIYIWGDREISVGEMTEGFYSHRVDLR